MAKSSPISPSRRVAFEVLARVEEGAFASVLLNSKVEGLTSPDRNLVYELVMGVLRRQLWLDRLAEHFANRRVSELDPAIRIILRLGLYQLRFLSRIPESAAVNESVNLVKLARLSSATGLVNAILRRGTRERDYDPAAEIEDPVDRLAVTTSHPVWLIERWTKQLGVDEAALFAAANDESAPVAFRVVERRSSEADIIQQLKDAGAELVKSKIARHGWRVSGATQEIRSLASSGAIYIQDEASQLLAEALGSKSGERVLDACAAPGSKTTQIAAEAPQAIVYASDLYDHRLQTIQLTAATQGLDNVRLIRLDALKPLPFPDNTFDRVLVDAPCTGTGTLRRNPEIRWRLLRANVEELSALQQVILGNAAQVVKPGGRLVYSTCSVEPEENEGMIRAFLAGHPDFEPAELDI